VTVVVRPKTEADLPALHAIQLDPDGRWQAAFVPAVDPGLEAYVAKHRRLLADDTVTDLVVELDGEVVGSAACFVVEGDREVTYWVRRDLTGRGLASTALSAVLERVTERPVFGRCVADNEGSAGVLQRAGFVRVGEEEAWAEGRGATVRELVFRLD
jgi:RimJ/RimL family protein N-acetyltransferase